MSATIVAVRTEPPMELPSVDRGRVGQFQERYGYLLILVLEGIMFLAAWEWLTSVSGLVNPVFLPPPTKVFGALADLFASGAVWPHLRFSATSWIVGFGLAAIVGVSAGLLMGTFRPIRMLIGPVAWSLYVTPHISIRPMLVIWFGFGTAPIVALIFVSAIFPILLTTAAGVQTVDPAMVRAARVFGARWHDIERKVILPATLPFIVIGLRLAIPTSLIGMLVGEILGTGQGIGAILALGTATFRVDQAIAAIVILVTASLILLRLFAWMEHRVAPWRHAREIV